MLKKLSWKNFDYLEKNAFILINSHSYFEKQKLVVFLIKKSYIVKMKNNLLPSFWSNQD